MPKKEIYKVKPLLVFGLVLSSLLSQVVYGDSGSSNKERAHEITTLFLAYKLVISDSQPLINDPNIGDKGLTGKVVRKKGREKYRELTEKEYKPSSDPVVAKAQVAMERSIDKVINDAQESINMKNIGFKGFITAVFARRLANEFSKRMQGTASLKFTAPKHLLRSNANVTDDWEESVFRLFSQTSWQKSKAFHETTRDGYRWMVPIYHEEGCLTCHGGPKGSQDITGYLKEGAELGDLAGAFSVILK